MLTLGRWLEPLLLKTLPSERFIDNVPVMPDSPQEDEIALANMTEPSFYHGKRMVLSYWQAQSHLPAVNQASLEHYQ